MVLNKHRTSCFNSLSVHPSTVIRKKGRNKGTEVFRFTTTSERRMIADHFFLIFISAIGTSELRIKGPRRNNVCANSSSLDGPQPYIL
jgi:hypothetical protein